MTNADGLQIAREPPGTTESRQIIKPNPQHYGVAQEQPQPAGGFMRAASFGPHVPGEYS